MSTHSHPFTLRNYDIKWKIGDEYLGDLYVTFTKKLK